MPAFDAGKKLGSAKLKLEEASRRLVTDKEPFAAEEDLEHAQSALNGALRDLQKVERAKENELDPDCKPILQTYCSVLHDLNDYHTRAHAIHREIGPLSSSYAAVRGYATGGPKGERGADTPVDRLVSPNAVAPPRTQAQREAAVQQPGATGLPSTREESQQRLLTVLQNACGLGYILRDETKDKTRRNPGLIDQAEDKIDKLQRMLNWGKSTAPWFCASRCKKDVPKCACYVGHFRDCHGDCYVWVMPDQAAGLREFTLTILTLAPNEKQDISFAIPGRGAAFSPGSR